MPPPATTRLQAIRTGHRRAHLRAAGYQLDPDRLQVTVDPAGLLRGVRDLTVTASYQVPLDDLLTIDLLPGQLTLATRHQEPIDPHKSR